MLHTAEEPFAPLKPQSNPNAFSTAVGADLAASRAARVPIALTGRHRWVMREGRSFSAGEFLAGRGARLGEGRLADLPAPFLLKGVREAALRLAAAMDASEPIIVFGDYDVDGTTSVAMLRRFFSEIGHPVDVYIPERLVEGYGLNPTGLRNIREKYADAGRLLVVTVDNGIAAVEACRVAKDLGIDVIITDHHDLPPQLPDAPVIVNPKQEDCTFPYRMLAGVGVAFYVMAGLRSVLRDRGHAGAASVNLRRSLDLVALGTIADLAPLDGVNHTLCRIGLEVMYEHVVQGTRPGVAALLHLAGWNVESGKVDASDVGFKIGPRLNAAGRLGNALATEELLSTNDAIRANELAGLLHTENTERQRLEREITAQAFAQIEAARLAPAHGSSGDDVSTSASSEAPTFSSASFPAAFVLHSPEWHTGVVGIVASRVLEKFYRPTLVLGTLDGKIKGSGRSTHAFDLFSALNAVRGEFLAFGGHFHAVGVSIVPDRLAWLQSYLAHTAETRIAESERLHPLEIDGTVPLAGLGEELLEGLTVLEPFGMSNPRPKWLIPHVTLVHIKRVGKAADSNHARVAFRDASGEREVIAFNMAREIEDCAALARSAVADGTGQRPGQFHLVVEGRLQLFRGRWKPELRLVDFTLASGGEHEYDAALR